MPKKLHNALTTLKVKNAETGRYADGGGLYLFVKDTGARSWVFRYTLDKRQRDIGLGAAAGIDPLTLKQARDAATVLRVKVKAGIHPLDERKQIKAKAKADKQAAIIEGITFRDMAETHIAAHEDSWKNAKHRQQWRNTLSSYAYPVIGDLPVAQIETAHVLKILEPIWTDKNQTASRVRGRIETILDAAKARGYRTGDNPARWRGHIEQILPAKPKHKQRHQPALPHERMAEFMLALQSHKGTAALALEFTILTASRSGAVLQAQWQQIDLANGIWTIPAENMKAAKEHRVPLSSRAIAILKEREPLGERWVFQGARGGKMSDMAMAMHLRRMQAREVEKGRAGFIDPVENRPATVHGFRSSFRDWADERTAYPHEMKELALAHTIANKAEAAYRRGDMMDKRRRLMEDWATYCARPIAAAGDNVTQLNAAKSA
jgi:integrase